MNLFILDQDIQANATAYYDTHVVKMPTEHFQMISFNIRKHCGNTATPHLLLPGEKLGILEDGKVGILEETLVCARFNKAHYNHPCTVWARQSVDNTLYMVELTQQLEKEWRMRYGHAADKRHKSVERMEQLLEHDVYKQWATHVGRKGLTPFAKAVPDDWKKLDTISAYRQTYRNEKASLRKYTNQQAPAWLDNV